MEITTNNPFIELDLQTLMETNGGGTMLAIATGLTFVGIVALTVLNPPAGAVAATVWKAAAVKTVAGIVATGGAYYA
ncbi:hypothetical protein [Alkaliphilus hydrothermalis]|uniref:CBS-domain-containing membrane protein n=1 Tax=Alkaliphilus hydrothermalis TaxID=1482730 RepID=A0ABS2NQ07_9FIRM|nr:hypothetical protein [Alkaliphilus hydrothermalis]MBM7615038.1 CBS-domain-containing membrane protein [Alkaliphilus hydrothermalis]